MSNCRHATILVKLMKAVQRLIDVKLVLGPILQKQSHGVALMFFHVGSQ